MVVWFYSNSLNLRFIDYVQRINRKTTVFIQQWLQSLIIIWRRQHVKTPKFNSILPKILPQMLEIKEILNF